MIQEQLSTALKVAMKAHKKNEVGTLRLMLSTLKDRNIQARTEKNGGEELSDDQVITVLQGMIKQRRQSIDMFEKGNRPELAEKEQEEITVIQGFLPKEMSAEEVTKAIQEAIQATGAEGMKDMGRVIGLLKEKHAGQIDFSQASALIKSQLS